jgi:molecular chaperone GrpE
MTGIGNPTMKSGDSKGDSTGTDQPAQFRVVDKRHFAHPENAPSQAAVEDKPRYPTVIEELMARLSETERRFDEKRKQVDAEIGRMKTRLESDYERKVSLYKQKLLLSFLDVLDNLERAIEAAKAGGKREDLLQGVEMTANVFRSKLQEQGVAPIPVLDQPFDPNLHQALGVVEVSDESKDGQVAEEVLRGYKLGDQLLRAAQVRVGRSSK